MMIYKVTFDDDLMSFY